MSKLFGIMMSDYNSNILYQPKLDGTEAITTMIGSQTPIITNNTLYGGAGYLNKGWDNSGLWKLTLKGYSTTDINNTGTGILLCPPTVTQRDYDEIQISDGGVVYVYNNGSGIGSTALQFRLTCHQEWTEYTFEKTSATQIVIRGNGYQNSYNWSSLPSYSKMCVGVDCWVSQYSMSIKEILVEKI